MNANGQGSDVLVENETLRVAPEEPSQARRGVAWYVFHYWGWSFKRISFEWLLTGLHWPNGGGVILIRSLLIGLEIYLVVLGLKNALDPDRSWTFSMIEFGSQVVATLPWFGTIFAVVYASLYARFSSQWTYLANVYNQIKAAECKGGCKEEALAEWKAGFMEDAEELHLVEKRLFASVLHAWSRESDVKANFIAHAPGGERRFDALMERVNRVRNSRSNSG